VSSHLGRSPPRGGPVDCHGKNVSPGSTITRHNDATRKCEARAGLFLPNETFGLTSLWIAIPSR
jgi:hypothetical protein